MKKRHLALFMAFAIFVVVAVEREYLVRVLAEDSVVQGDGDTTTGTEDAGEETPDETGNGNSTDGEGQQDQDGEEESPDGEENENGPEDEENPEEEETPEEDLEDLEEEELDEKLLMGPFMMAAFPFALPVTDYGELETAIEDASPGDTIYIGNSFILDDALVIDKDLHFSAMSSSVVLYSATGTRHFIVEDTVEELSFTNVILNGNNSGGGLEITLDGNKFTFKGANIQNCKEFDGAVSIEGEDSEIYFNDCNFANNQNDNAGGIYIDQCSKISFNNCKFANNIGLDSYSAGGFTIGTVTDDGMTIKNSTFTGNRGEYAGGFYITDIHEDVLLDTVVFTGNIGQDDASAGGFLINDTVYGDFQLNGSRFSNNTGDIAGGFYCFRVENDVDIQQSSFENNVGEDEDIGGGGFLIGDIFGNLAIGNVGFKSNQGGMGGGFNAADTISGSVDILTCEFDKNIATSNHDSGGGFYIFYAEGDFLLENTPFTENKSERGGGFVGVHLRGDVTINNNNFYKNIGLDDESGGGFFISDIGGGFTLEATPFTENNGGWAGGFYVGDVSGVAAIEKGEFYKNTASDDDGIGGFFIERIEKDFLLASTPFIENQGDKGGGFRINDVQENVTVSQGRFQKNSALEDDESSGGFFISNIGGSFSISNTPFTENSGGVAGGFFIWSISENAEILHGEFYKNIARRTDEGAGGFNIFYLEEGLTLFKTPFTENKGALAGGFAIESINNNASIQQGDFKKNTATAVDEGVGGFFMGNIEGIVLAENVVVTENKGDKTGGMHINKIEGDATIHKAQFSKNISVMADEGAGGFAIEAVKASAQADGSLTVKDTLVKNNTGGLTGGFLLGQVEYDLLIEDCTVSENKGHIAGGFAAISISENAVIQGNTIVNKNKASRDDTIIEGAGGFFLETAKTVLVDGATVTNNDGYYGGAFIHDVSEDFTLENSSFTQNTGAFAGGIYIEEIGQKAEMKSCNFIRNTSDGSGGGVYLEEANDDISIQGSLFEDNLAGTDGGAIYIDAGYLDKLFIDGVNFVNNTAAIGYYWDINDQGAAGYNLYHQNVMNTKPSMPFNNAYNNFDIAYGVGGMVDLASIRYNGNGHTSGEAPKTTRYFKGDTATVSGEGNMERKGYSFVNWNTEKSGQGISYVPNESFVITDDVLLYARWSANDSGGEDGGDKKDPEPDEKEEEPDDKEEPGVGIVPGPGVDEDGGQDVENTTPPDVTIDDFEEDSLLNLGDDGSPTGPSDTGNGDPSEEPYIKLNPKTGDQGLFSIIGSSPFVLLLLEKTKRKK